MKYIKQHEPLIILLLLVIANLVVKGIFLGANSLAEDEPFSVYIAQMDIPSIIRLLADGNNPPLYEILLHFWIKTFGISELSVRLPSLLFSSLSVLFIYKIGATFINHRVALYSSVIFIFSDYHIMFAHQSRVYALLGLLSVASAYFFMCILQADFESGTSTSKRRKTILYISLTFANTLLIYAHYFGFFILITQLLFIGMHPAFLVKNWKKVLVSACAVLLLYSPYIAIVIHRFIASSGGMGIAQTPSGIDGIYYMIWQFSNMPVIASSALVICIGALAKYLSNFRKAPSNIQAKYLVFWFCFIFFFMFGVSFWLPMFLDRYMMQSAIAYPIVLALSADYLITTRRYRLILPSLLCLLFMITANPNLTIKRSIIELVDKVKSLKSENSMVYFCPDWFELNFAYYYNVKYFEDYNTPNLKQNIHNYLKAEHIYPVKNRLQLDSSLKVDTETIIYIDASADYHYPDNQIKPTLDANFRMTDSINYNSLYNVYRYTKR